ncbi:putative L-amino acid oxidase [Amylostereum chailletii]|nr:putative L-amino acid oxidase [Amylostereum chailletii]
MPALVYKNAARSTFEPKSVGIVGGGIAGLYAAKLLQREGHYFHIFEGSDRVGGRIKTHYFSHEDNQYFEAGAMRIPKSSFHDITFDLIDYLQSFKFPEDKEIRLIEYVLTTSGNSMLINDVERSGAHAAVAATTPASLDWDVPSRYQHMTASSLMWDAISPFIEDLRHDFEDGFEKLLKFDHLSFRLYLSDKMGWPTSVIDFVETVTSQTNQFMLSCTELVMQNMDFDTEEWATIDRGMSRLPNALASLIGYENITFNARVSGLRHEKDGRVTITATRYGREFSRTFDDVILAIPPPALSMIANRPRWSPEKEMAIRSMHLEPLYKMGLRFKTRFWERVKCRSFNSMGGQSATDLPIRWIVYPSNGQGTDGPGVLLVYAWMTDASSWLPLTQTERQTLALDCIARVFQGQLDEEGKPIDIYDLIMECADAVWCAATATGDAMFLPGQFVSRFESARKPEDNIYFAGEHLSKHHTWISGAVESALDTVRLLLNDPGLEPLRPASNKKGADKMKVV